MAVVDCPQRLSARVPRRASLSDAITTTDSIFKRIHKAYRFASLACGDSSPGGLSAYFSKIVIDCLRQGDDNLAIDFLETLKRDYGGRPFVNYDVNHLDLRIPL